MTTLRVRSLRRSYNSNVLVSSQPVRDRMSHKYPALSTHSFFTNAHHHSPYQLHITYPYITSLLLRFTFTLCFLPNSLRSLVDQPTTPQPQAAERTNNTYASRRCIDTSWWPATSAPSAPRLHLAATPRCPRRRSQRAHRSRNLSEKLWYALRSNSPLGKILNAT